jgi:5-methylcytosine-specific restriction endonuclease McrA
MDYQLRIKELEEENAKLKEELHATKEHLKKYTAPASSKIYYEKHKEDICLKGKVYRENKRKNGTFVEGKRDSIKKRCSSQRRKARKHGLTATFNRFEWDECKQFFNFQCAYCDKEDSLAQDHFIPLAKGGGYEKSNIVPACMICNSYKRDLDFLEWYPQQEFYSEERKEKIFKYLGF